MAILWPMLEWDESPSDYIYLIFRLEIEIPLVSMHLIQYSQFFPSHKRHKKEQSSKETVSLSLLNFNSIKKSSVFRK